jgi:small neutral amino acid transporter SnatA (MarC family)
MSRELTLFIGTFTTLLAIINPFEVLPVYLKTYEFGASACRTHMRLPLWAIDAALGCVHAGVSFGPSGTGK